MAPTSASGTPSREFGRRRSSDRCGAHRVDAGPVVSLSAEEHRQRLQPRPWDRQLRRPDGATTRSVSGSRSTSRGGHGDAWKPSEEVIRSSPVRAHHAPTRQRKSQTSEGLRDQLRLRGVATFQLKHEHRVVAGRRIYYSGAHSHLSVVLIDNRQLDRLRRKTRGDLLNAMSAHGLSVRRSIAFAPLVDVDLASAIVGRT